MPTTLARRIVETSKNKLEISKKQRSKKGRLL